MNSKVEIHFDKNKTIKENAELIGVSEKTIKNYMFKKSISGHNNNYNQRILKFAEAQKELEKKEIKPTVKNLSNYLNWSNNTTIKYKKLIDSNAEKGSKILPHIAPKYHQLIKSVNSSQIDILHHILKLHIPKKKFDCDLTFSVGGFYKNGIPQPELKFDKYPTLDDVKPLHEIENITDNCIESVVVDPPFMLDYRPKEVPKPNNLMIDRFSSFINPKELYDAYIYLIDQSYRILTKNGIMVFKCMPTTWGGKPLDTPFFVKNYCYGIGFEFTDEFILTAKSKMVNSRHHTQKHSLKNHSYFIVFGKVVKKNR